MSKEVSMNIAELRTLEDMIEILKKEKHYKEAIKYGTNNYNIAQYKINKVKLQQIPQLVNLIQLNYINLQKQLEHSIQKKKNSWLANQLKLFVWMAVCHSYLNNKPLEEYEQQHWTFFTNVLTRKTCHDLDFQSKSLFKNYKGNKQKWDPQQQHLLKNILQDQRYHNKWNEISRILYFQSNKKYYRSSQKCRQYWFNHLDERLNKNPWTVEEDLRLVGQLLIYGFKWSKLTQVIESTWGYRRTQHMVKNRTKLLCKKYGYKDEKQQGCMKELKMIEKKLKEQKSKLQSVFNVQVKQEQSVQQKSFNTLSSGTTSYGKSGEGKVKDNVIIKNGNEKGQMIDFGISDNVTRQIMVTTQNILNNSGKGINNYGSINIFQEKRVKQQQLIQSTQQKDNEKMDCQKQSQSQSQSQSQQSAQSQSQSQDNSSIGKKKRISKVVNKKAKRPTITHQSQSVSNLQDRHNNKRQVIILYQASSEHQHQSQQLQQPMPQQPQQQPLNQEQQQSSEIIIGQHVQEEQQKTNQYDQQQQEDNNNNKEDFYYDEYNIIEEVPDQQIDFNEDIQFQHDTHGGKMRQRVTHQLAKYFPTNQQN